ncbi:MAG: hypothetical protein ABI972_18000 [Acidobacteriota bacterium]
MQTPKMLAVILLAATPLLAQPASPRLHDLPAASKNVVTGPAVGEKVPNFQLADQSGRLRNFRSLAGRNGLLLAFVRSADW